MLALELMGLPFPFNPQFSGLRRSHCSSMNISFLIITLRLLLVDRTQRQLSESFWRHFENDMHGSLDVDNQRSPCLHGRKPP